VEVRREFETRCSGEDRKLRSASLSTAIDVEVVEEEHGCPSRSVGEFGRVWVLGDEASCCLILPVEDEDEGDDGCSGGDVIE
jgi:hypothetical protein